MSVKVLSQIVTYFLSTFTAMSHVVMEYCHEMSWKFLLYNLHEFVTGNKLYERHLRNKFVFWSVH